MMVNKLCTMLFLADFLGMEVAKATFDEANLDAPEHELTPSKRAIWNTISCTKSSSPVTDEIVTPPKSLNIFAEATPFVVTTKVTIPIKCTTPLLGIKLESDPLSRRNVIVDVLPNSSAHQVSWEDHLLNHTIVVIGDVPV